MKLLMTGFEPFYTVGDNPSQRIVAHFATYGSARDDVVICAEALPVVYDGSWARLSALVGQFQPDVVLLLGVAQSRNAINLERFALNMDDASIADNAGDLRQGVPIVAGGPDAYQTTLPITAIYDRLRAAGIPVRLSNHAGTYVCNHIFYAARHHLPDALPCGFVHVPAMGDEPPALPLSTLIEAVQLCIDVLANTVMHR